MTSRGAGTGFEGERRIDIGGEKDVISTDGRTVRDALQKKRKLLRLGTVQVQQVSETRERAADDRVLASGGTATAQS